MESYYTMGDSETIVWLLRSIDPDLVRIFVLYYKQTNVTVLLFSKQMIR